ncbi:MAG: hypothetical protein V3U23_11120, partial [Kiloniellales bacterium]
ATQRAWDYMLKNPETAVPEAARIMAAAVDKSPPPDLIAKYALKVIPSRMVTPATKGKPVGWSSPKDWQAMIDVLNDHDKFPRKPSVEEMLINRFVQ